MPSPQRETPAGFSAYLRVVRPGEDAPATTPASLAPIHPRVSGAVLTLVWAAFRIGVWLAIMVWLLPGLLEHVGARDLGKWIDRHIWVRILTAPPLALMAFISVQQPVNDPKRQAAREGLASRTGGTLYQPRGLDPELGLVDGPGLRIPVGAWSMDIASWKREGRTRSVARVLLETRCSFSFVARGAGSEPQLLRGLQQHAMALATKRMSEEAKDPRAAAAAAAVAYLGEPPVPIGVEALDRAVVLRANQPDAARALLSSDGVAQAIAALDGKLRTWDWTLYPTRQEGFAELRFESPNVLGDEEALRLVQSLLRAALEQLAGAGIIAPGR